jgi:hypothetical protein
MGSVYSMTKADPSDPNGGVKPGKQTFLPLVGSGAYTVGCADLMVEEASSSPTFSGASEGGEVFFPFGHIFHSFPHF